MEDIKSQKSELKKACVNCGAELLYAPGTTTLVCEYCSYEETIQPLNESFEELELKPYLEKIGGQSHSEEIAMLQCKNCGANQHIEEHYKSLHCIYCSMPLIIEDAYKEEWILPGAVLPFQIDHKKAHLIFKSWVKGLWFAPNKLKKAVLNPELVRGLYLPYWTFDAYLNADYTGQRGDYYYVNVPYTTTQNGKTVTRTRQERRTRWSYASGHVNGFVDDTLVRGSRQNTGNIPSKITRWDLKKLKAFDSSYLSGFVTEKYTISLKDGHLKSTDEARKIAELWARRDIGGDTQRVSSIDMELSNETFKHILLPVYISTYKFNGKRYNFYVNGENGSISGDRPYSFWKIFLTVIVVLIVIVLIAQFAK
ncbi:DNA helicase PriA [Aestuariibaculum suncheonense]|uniref:DNA helicase PriA n=1 Tax=Aestuariibaculum suncheonense TaxID=1028745 RepID=A0A8J6QAU4_9FLAO|nr:DNA helicase PriA [Aestuariibaculum suncheonense]MBD0836771.1 DNA helicase PriA [Aestuariibaculum suncheonense]